VVITPDGLTALVVSPGDSSIVVFDVVRRRARDTLAVAGGPKVIAVSPDGRRAYLTHPERGLVTLIDLATFRVVRTAEVPGAPDGVAVLEPVP
jgi:DNA-binding beta-propeller fold protein YncE